MPSESIPLSPLPDKVVAAGPPLDIRDLAVRLETEGITDTVAADDYGFRDVWHMAAHYFPSVDGPAPPTVRDLPRPRLWLEYLEGVSFALPLLLCSLSMLLLRFSLWGGNLSIEAATAVGLGTISSFIVSGGFVQGMARRGMFYLSTASPVPAALSTWAWIRRGTMALLVVAAAGVAVSTYYNILPPWLEGLTALFHTELGVFWLIGGALYMIGRWYWVAAATLAGLVCVGILQTAGVPLLTAQAIGLLAASAGAGVALVTEFRRIAPSAMPGRPGVEQAAQTAYYSWPYFLYGVLYYFFLFEDRIVAWSADTMAASLPLRFRGDYETALDIALLAFVVQVGWVHLASREFRRRLVSDLDRFSIEQTERLAAEFRGFYRRQLLFFATVALATQTALYFGAYALGFLEVTAVRMVALVALAGYPFLVAGLWNVSLLFALARPLEALQAISAGIVLNTTAGYTLSRIGDYSFAVLGFTAGAILFAILSGLAIWRLFGRIDYYHFAAAA